MGVISKIALDEKNKRSKYLRIAEMLADKDAEIKWLKEENANQVWTKRTLDKALDRITEYEERIEEIEKRLKGGDASLVIPVLAFIEKEKLKGHKLFNRVTEFCKGRRQKDK